MRLLALACVLLCATAVAQTPVESPEVPNAEFEHLLRATDYLSNFQDPAFGKYGRLVASREYSVAVMECVKNSDAVKRSGLKL